MCWPTPTATESETANPLAAAAGLRRDRLQRLELRLRRRLLSRQLLLPRLLPLRTRLRLLRLLAPRRALRRRIRSGRRRGRGNRRCAAFAVRQPHVVDRVL